MFTSHIDVISQTDLIIRTKKKKSEKKVEVPICNFANQIFEEVFNIQKGHFQNNSSECLHDEVSLLISISSQQNHQVKSFFVKGLLVKFVRLFKTEFINQFVVRLIKNL